MKWAIGIGCLFCFSWSAMAQSLCFGLPAKGRLEHGVALPYQGENFISYSRLAQPLQRSYVHSAVAGIVTDTYALLAEQMPQYRYKYAETGSPQGGLFAPHKTHQNGLSVDFMTPMKDRDGVSQWLPTNLNNRYGYDIELDRNGYWQGWQIDYEAMAAHLWALHQTALAAGYDVNRVIFAPELQPALFQTRYGHYLKRHVRFSGRRAWVRHDEHYHVDFQVPCHPLN